MGAADRAADHGCCAMILRIIGVLTLLALITMPKVLGAPPAGADPNSPTAQWFRSLTQPGSGASCCDLSDCRTVSARGVTERDENGFAIGGHYEVLISPPTFPVAVEQWVRVPPERILTRADNPTGKPVVCWTPWKGVICFVRPAET